MIRILALVLGLALAVGAIFVLVSGGPGGGSREVAPPLDEIDDASRAKLERVLEDADGRARR